MCVIIIVLLILFYELFSFLPLTFSVPLFSRIEKREKWEGEENYLFSAENTQQA